MNQIIPSPFLQSYYHTFWYCRDQRISRGLDVFHSSNILGDFGLLSLNWCKKRMNAHHVLAGKSFTLVDKLWFTEGPVTIFVKKPVSQPRKTDSVLALQLVVKMLIFRIARWRPKLIAFFELLAAWAWVGDFTRVQPGSCFVFDIS